MGGCRKEPMARAAYELQTGNTVDDVGFMRHPSVPRMGGSLDGIVGQAGGIEIKCPKTSTHIKWMLDGIVPDEHVPQMTFYMAVAGLQWMDFISYDARLPEALQLFIVRLERNQAAIDEMEQAVYTFNTEVDSMIERLREFGEFVIPAAQAAKAPVSEFGITDEDIAALEASR